MAGIGFRLRALVKNDSYFGLLQAYGIAGIISSGPWVIAIVGILIIGILNTENSSSSPFVGEFQISVTYLMAFSILLTSPLQLMFTRFVADRLYEKQDEAVLPNLLGAILVVIIVSGTLAGPILVYLFTGSLIYRVLMLIGFVTLSATWIVVVFLSSLKEYRGILLAFFLGYGLTISVALRMQTFGVEGLLVGFVLGHGVLFFMLLYLVLHSYTSQWFISFDFCCREKIFPSLALTGFFYNLGVWADKLIFWFNPQTSISVIEPLRGSEIYDLPIFLAYLSIIPGMAVFLIRMETDFAEQYERFYRAINTGMPLRKILQIHADMIGAVRHGILEIFKVQGMTVVILLAIGDSLLAWVGISPLYKILLNINLVTVGVQVLLLAILNFLFYFDYRAEAMYLCLGFALSNIFFTLLTHYLGPAFYGYGFAVAVLTTTVAGLIIVSRKSDRLVYETFMLR